MTRPTVLGDIIAQAETHPDQVAAKDLDRELTYAELIHEAGQLGTGLRARGVAIGDRVALLIPNSVDFIVAALGTLWAGAVFVPLAVTDPPIRLATIVQDCTPKFVLTSETLDTSLPTSLDQVTPLAVTAFREDRTEIVEVIDDPSHAAYMIYTSGTTGTPKGVQIDVAAFAAAVHSTAQAIGLSQATRTLCVSPFHFDGSYANLFTTLVVGGTVVIRPRDALLFPRTFFNTVAKESINYSGFTPSYLRLLLASPQLSQLSDTTLEIIALGGETVSVNDLRSLWSIAPELRVFNRYGPTETTIAVTNVELTPDMIQLDTITIGRPHPGVTFTLVNDGGQIIETANEVGELYVGGSQLMVGYWANPELTNTVMRSDILDGSTLYRTGDLVFRHESGSYVYVDRADRVIKRSGVRISLIELAASMNKLEGVVAAACMTYDDDGKLGIVAFVVVDAEYSFLELRRAASTLIPENMLPDRIEVVSSMPLNKSNQLDEHQLLSAAGLRPFRPTSSQPPPPS